MEFKGVIFDLDGVITSTAMVHFAAWKAAFEEYLHLREKRNHEPFREFTHDDDYLPYIDGKPRYDGVKSFLESRNINLPYGSPSDTPDKETICGVGNKKNEKFLETLKAEKAKVYLSSVQLVKELKRLNFSVGVASSSKNCEYILDSVGIKDLFETIVDGRVSARLKLKGKPEADIFVKAAKNIGLVPLNSVVVEDATSGVAAGRNGGFGLVIGVARKDNQSELLKNGADCVVKDLSEITIDWIRQWFNKYPLPLFKFWDSPPKVLLRSSGEISQDKSKVEINPYYFRKGKSIFSREKKPVFFLDYDGTLTPIVKRPELAVISDCAREIIKKLSKKFRVAIVSGRMREDVEKLAGISEIFYAGSHGFDIRGPGFSLVLPQAKETIPLIEKIIKELKENLGKIEGLLVEEKKFSVAVHWRLVNEKHLLQIKDFVEQIVKSNPTLRMMEGKKVFEILPAIDWDKGKAVRWIMQALKISWEDSSVVYIGDDTTDEDAFRCVRTRGCGILVSDENKESCADFRVSSPDEVMKLFEKVLTPTPT